jgi:hypothetical protein
MKKILRLVTTSVLTLTLVACGEASSSVSSSVSSSASSSVASSSVASSFAAVTSITLAPAATDALTQVVGSLKTVVINASFNTGVNPDLRVSWLVNGVASQQTGRAFEFTPTAAGVFKIKARVGTVESQEQTVTVTAQGVSTLSITSHTFVSSTRIEVVATGGAEVVVTGATLDKDASFYDLEGKKYVLILEEALEQGDSVKVSLTRDGSTAEDTFVYDTRKLELNLTALATTYASAITAGTVTLTATKITLVRPHILASDGTINVTPDNYVFPVKVTDLDGTEVPFSVTRTSAPAGAVAAPVNQGSVDIDDNTLSTAVQVSVSLTRETPVGDYVYSIRVGAKTIPLTITVEDTKPTLKLNTAIQTTGTGKTSFKLSQVLAGVTTVTGVTGTGTDKNVFEVTKDYSLASVADKAFQFKFDATNISVPTNLLGTVNQSNAVTPNQMLVSLAGPGGISFMRVDSTVNSQIPLPPPVAFRNTASTTVNGIIDNSTPVGDYVYTVRILQLGVEIHKATVTVTVKDPVAKLDFTIDRTVENVVTLETITAGKLYHTSNDLTLIESSNQIFLPGFTTLTLPAASGDNEGEEYFDQTTKQIKEVVDDGDDTYSYEVVDVAEGLNLFDTTSREYYVVTSGSAATDSFVDETVQVGDILVNYGTGDSDFEVFKATSTDNSSAFTLLNQTDDVVAFPTIAFVYQGANYDVDDRGWVPLTSGYILNSATDELVIIEAGEEEGDMPEFDYVEETSSGYFLDLITGKVYQHSGGEEDSDYTLLETNVGTVDSPDLKVNLSSSAVVDSNIYVNGGLRGDATGLVANDYWFDNSTANLLVLNRQSATNTSVVQELSAGTIVHTDTNVYVAFDSSSEEEELNWKVLKDRHYVSAKFPETTSTFEEYKLFIFDTSDNSWDLSGPENSRALAIQDENIFDLVVGGEFGTNLQRQLLNDLDVLFVDGGVLKVTIEKDVATQPTFTAKTLTVNRPLLVDTNEILLEFNAVIQNYQSPLNPTAAAANSFTAVANAAGLAGTREFLAFKKSYTGPQTLDNSINSRETRVALVNDNRLSSDTDVTERDLEDEEDESGQANRLNVPEYFDLIVGGRAETILDAAFEFPITSTTTLGTYVFTLTIGNLTETFTVIVEAPKQAISLFVSNNLTETTLTPNATTGVINVNLDEYSEVDLSYAIRLDNMERTTNQNINYTLTRTFSFGTTKWNDLKTDVFEGQEDTYGNLNVPLTFISILQGVESHLDFDNTSLKLDSVGTYTYKLEIGSLVRTWSIVVKEFPTLSLENAYLGTEDDIDTDKVAIMKSVELAEDGYEYVIIIEERDNERLDDAEYEELDHLYLEVKGVNLPTGAVYFQITESSSPAPLVTLTDKALSFDKTTGMALIKISTGMLDFDEFFDGDEDTDFYIHLYNSSSVAVGYLSLYIIVNDVYDMED